MKKIGTLIAFTACVMSLGFQNLRAQAPTTSRAMNFTNDIVIESNTLADQRKVHIASGFNGWMYAAYVVNDTNTHKSGVELRYSRDGGITWTSFGGYHYFQHSWYGGCDITVAGADTNKMAVYVSKIRKDMITMKYEVEVEKYFGNKAAVPATSVYFQQLDTNAVTDIAIANDWKQPAVGDSLFSLGLLYAHHGPVSDSLYFVVSHKAGKTWQPRTLVYTGQYLRHVALSYSHSLTSYLGVYHAAWELLGTPTSALGHIYTARTGLSLNTAWLTPTCLDSLSPMTNGYVRNPSIASQVNQADNDSSNTTVAVSFDLGRNGQTDSTDIAGYYNKRGDSTNFWNMFSVAATTDREMQSNMSYDYINNKFLITLYDSTTGMLSCYNQGNLLSTPNTWNQVSAQYNNVTTNLKAPWPRVCVNGWSGKSALAWVVDPSNHNGVAMFDGEYLITSTGPELSNEGLTFRSIYPNPSNTTAYLSISTDMPVTARLSVFDLLGQNVTPLQTENLAPGKQTLSLDVTSLPAGVYFCHIEAGTQSKTLRFVVQH